ncbi:PAS domain S-box protein, partial [Rhodovastum atsumiense]
MRSSWPCLLAILPLHFTGWTMRPAGLLGAWLNRRPVARILQGINRWRAGKAGAGTVPAAQVRAQPLPENEARFRVLAEFVPSLLFEAEASGANSWTSRNWLDYVGRSAGEMAGEGWASTIHPDDLPGVQALWRDAMGSGSDFVSRQRIRRGSDGAWRWHQVRAVPLRGAKGEILRWLGTANDVHDLLEAKAALQEQEELLRLFVDRTPAAIAMFDHDMRYLAISRRFLRDFALEQVPDPHALIGLSHYDIFPEIPSHWRDNNRRVLAGETLSAEEEPFRRPDGRVQWVRWEMTPWHRADGTVGGLMLFSEEITARKQAEAALRASEARFRAITDAMPQLVWSARPDGMTDYHNQRWHEFTGIPPEQRTDDDWAFILHPDDRDRVLAQWRHSVTTGQAFEQEYRLRRADGGHGWILGRAVPVRDPQSGAITRWFATGTDISDAVAAREALARSHAELERLVAERTAALTRAAAEQQQAEQAMRQGEKLAALGQLAGGIAHDFNNILQIISNCAALIDGDAGGDNGVGECVGMISDATERGHGIIRRLLAFARRGELRAGPIDPAALLDDMREVLTHTLASTVVLRFTVEPGLPVLLADRGQLEAALINLAVNARDAMPEGGTLTILAAVETVGTDAAPPLPLEPGAYVRFTLSDTGPGMDEATLARACEPFFTTKPRGRGTGLGLPMARGFAEQSGGALVIDSA